MQLVLSQTIYYNHFGVIPQKSCKWLSYFYARCFVWSGTFQFFIILFQVLKSMLNVYIMLYQTLKTIFISWDESGNIINGIQIINVIGQQVITYPVIWNQTLKSVCSMYCLAVCKQGRSSSIGSYNVIYRECVVNMSWTCGEHDVNVWGTCGDHVWWSKHVLNMLYGSMIDLFKPNMF